MKEEDGTKARGWTPLNFTKVNSPAVEKEIVGAKAEAPAVAATAEATVPAAAAAQTVTPEPEKPSEIKVTTDEAEVKTAEAKSAEQSPKKVDAYSGQPNKEDDTEDQVEKTDY